MKKKKFGDRVSDRIASVVGSWPFIITQSVVLILWIVLNVTHYINPWDPYPFILLNLMLSFQAGYTGPVVMMAQNRQEKRDRAKVLKDLEIDSQSLENTRNILETLSRLEKKVDEISSQSKSKD